MDWVNITRAVTDTALTKDLAKLFGSNFFHEFHANLYDVEATPNGNTERVVLWAYHDDIAVQDWYGQNDFEIVGLILHAKDVDDQYTLELIEKGGNSDSMTFTFPTLQSRYIQIIKQGSQIRVNVCQTSAYEQGAIDDSAEITLSGDLDFQYVSFSMAYGLVGNEVSSGYINEAVFGEMENLLGKFTVRKSASQELLGKFTAGFLVGSEELLGEFVSLGSGSQELLGEFKVQRTGTPQELLGIFTSQQAGNQELLGKFIVQHPASQELLAYFKTLRDSSQELLGIFTSQAIIDDQEELLAYFVSRFSGSQELLGEFVSGFFVDSEELLGYFDARRDGSQELLGIFNVTHSENLLAKFEIRSPANQELLGIFDVGQNQRELLGKFIVRTPVWTPRVDIGWETGDGTEWDAEATTNAVLSYPSFPGTHRYNYNGRIEITAQNGFGYWANIDAQNPQAGKWRIYIKLGHLPAAGNIIDFFRVYDPTGTQIASVRLFNDGGTLKWGYRVITGDGPAYSSYHSAERTGAVTGEWYEFELTVEMETSDGEANGGYSLRYMDSFLTDITQSNVNTNFQSLRSGRPYARYDGATASFIVDYDDYAAWYRYIGPDERENLPGEFEARRSDSRELLGVFNVTHSENLPAEFEARQLASQDLLGEFEARRDGSQELLGEFDVQRSASIELLGVFVSRQESSQELLGTFELPSAASQDLLGVFTAGAVGSENLLAEFRVAGVPGAEELLAGFFAVPIIGRDLRGSFTVRQSASQELKGFFITGGSEDLRGAFVIRRSTAQELKMIFEVVFYTTDLLGKIHVRPRSSTATNFGIGDTGRRLTITPRRRMDVR